jgi:hypothetical protein
MATNVVPSASKRELIELFLQALKIINKRTCNNLFKLDVLPNKNNCTFILGKMPK